MSMLGSACNRTVVASTDPSIFMLGTRSEAVPLRKAVESALDSGSGTVCVDFAGRSVTQSFIDEFLGVLILRRGPDIVGRLAFTNCSEDVAGIIRFVAAARSRDFRLEVAS